MRLLITGGTVFLNGCLKKSDIAIDCGHVVSISDSIPKEGFNVIEYNNCVITPGFVDVHVHLREPGFSYKETIASGTAAAAAGGYTDICSMPNLNPVPDSLENLEVQLRAIERDALVRVHPYASITRGEKGNELSDFETLAPYVIGFSDDGKGVQSEEMMRMAMLKAKRVGKPIVAHCEDESLLQKGWSVHAGDYACAHGLIGNPSESEWRQVERDIRLVRETGCRYHVCHVSTKESVALIREAKKQSLPVSCETTPHYLLLTDDELRDEGRFRMNPPIRSRQDRDALIEGLLDGTVDCIATDHAPHSADEKSKGLAGSLNGIVGLECAFSVLYEGLVRTRLVPVETLLNAMSINPRRLFGLDPVGPGKAANFVVIYLDMPHRIDSSAFLSMGRATPFDGWNVSAGIDRTIIGGKTVYCTAEERRI